MAGIAIPEETTNNIINKIYEKLPKTVVYAYPLIKQSEVNCYKHMAEASEWIGDEGSTIYFENMAIKADKMAGIKNSRSNIFPKFNSYNFFKEDTPGFDRNCLKMIEDKCPDIKDIIIAGLKKRICAQCQNVPDAPF